MQIGHAADQQRALDRGVAELRTVQSTASGHCSTIAGSGTTLTLSNSETASAAPRPVTAGASYSTPISKHAKPLLVVAFSRNGSTA
jgi:hypothetical protein